MRSGVGWANLLVDGFRIDGFQIEAIDTNFQAAQGLCSDSWKVRPMAITSPTDFICVVRRRIGLREFLEGETRHLGDT